jgi:hypothetical protein
MALRAREDCSIFELCLLLQNNHGQRVALADFRSQAGIFVLPKGKVLRITGTLRRIALVPGSYAAGFFIRTNQLMKDYLGLQSLEVMPEESVDQVLTYTSEYLGSVALDSVVANEIS